MTVLALVFAASGTALAFPSDDQPGALVDSGLSGLIGDDDVFSTADLSLLLAPVAPLTGSSTPTQHYGPYTTDDTDSGCGVDPWANETFDRHFTVKSNHDGTFTVVEQFKNGSFETIAGLSPGEQCPEKNEAAGAATVEGGVIGSMHGYFIISTVGAQTSSSASCDANNPDSDVCNTTIFINSHFAPCYPVTCTVGTFFFHYVAGDQGLVEHEWRNASSDRGGNNGDISSTDED